VITIPLYYSGRLFINALTPPVFGEEKAHSSDIAWYQQFDIGYFCSPGILVKLSDFSLMSLPDKFSATDRSILFGANFWRA